MRMYGAGVLCVLFLCVLAFVPGSFIRTAHAASDIPAGYAALGGAVDNALKTAMQSNRIVGGVVFVAHNGVLVHHKAYGDFDREHSIPMRENAVFRLSSLTKAYTAMATAALVTKGIVQLDDPVRKWLPQFTPKLSDGSTPPITIRQLLAHTAGLDYGFNQPAQGPYHTAGISDGLDISPLTLQQNVERIASVPLLFTPGSSWNYSVASDVLGAVIAKAYGTPFDQAMQELVLIPLQLADTGFHVTHPQRLAPAYRPATPQPLPMQADERIPFGASEIRFAPERIMRADQFPSGGAGMAGTAADMLTLLETLRTGSAPLTTPDLALDMMSLQTADNCVAPGVGFGLGWGVVHNPAAQNSPEAPGSIGWGGVYGHSWHIDPTNKLTIVLMTNTAIEGLFGQVVSDVRAAVYSSLPK